MTETVVVGTTTWGTTLALLLARNGVETTLLSRTQVERDTFLRDGENRRFLPGFTFPAALSISCDCREAMRNVSLVVIAVPAVTMRRNLAGICDHIPHEAVVLSATKGLEPESSKRMSQVLEEALPSHLHGKLCALSGPNLALEIAQGKYTSTVIASRNRDAASLAQRLLMSPVFRVYTSSDVVGVELGGALKNIIALGAGMADGMEAGDNGKAAFICRGLAEITRLGVACGASPLTFAGLAGLGDLIATCASRLSRNRYVGEQIARGRSLKEVLASMKNVAEGVPTTASALKMARSLNIEMPITEAIDSVLSQGVNPREAIARLMVRPPKPEWDDVG
jgi:glycerol-3-phosphate dehydrogenase (NAD(P)+)